jgi:hypothetical protein
MGMPRSTAPTKLQMSKQPGQTAIQPRLRLIKAARLLFDAEGTVEEALSAVLIAAEQSFACRIVFDTPATLRIDGYSYRWPDA